MQATPNRLLPRRLLLGGLAALPLIRRADAQVAHRLTILHMNDFHSRHAPVDGRSLTCEPGGKAAETCFGGSPHLAAAIREQRAAAGSQGRAVLLLDAGDQFQGSLFYTAHHGLAELAVQHAIGTDAMAVGNHEFDNGPPVLARYAGLARFPVLSANTDVSADPHLAPGGTPLIRPWAMLHAAGLPVAVIGLTTPETALTSSPGPDIRFTDPAPALAAAASAARAAGARLVIALSHLGLAADLALAAHGVPIIIGGHSHSLLSNTEPGALGPAPMQAGSGAMVVQAQAYGRYLGRLDLDLAEDGTILAHAAACRHIDPSLPPDPEVAAIVAQYGAPLEALRRKAVATLPAPLGIETCRLSSCELGTLVADTLREAGHAGIGLFNAGGLRVGLPAGPVTLGQVLDTMPFGNTLATANLTGAELADTYRHGIAMLGRGGFAQWAGLRLAPGGLQVQAQDGTWAPLDPAATYRLATNNYLRTGGDGYDMLKVATDAYDTGPGVADLFADRLAQAHP